MLDKYKPIRLYSTGAYDYTVNYSDSRYLVTLTYKNVNDDTIVNSIIVSMIKDNKEIPVNGGNRLFESLKEDLTKRGIEFKVNDNIINIENN